MACTPAPGFRARLSQSLATSDGYRRAFTSRAAGRHGNRFWESAGNRWSNCLRRLSCRQRTWSTQRSRDWTSVNSSRFRRCRTSMTGTRSKRHAWCCSRIYRAPDPPAALRRGGPRSGVIIRGDQTKVLANTFVQSRKGSGICCDAWRLAHIARQRAPFHSHSRTPHAHRRKNRSEHTWFDADRRAGTCRDDSCIRGRVYPPVHVLRG